MIKNSSTLFEKGREKTGGRQKGTPNRTTQEMRNLIQSVMDKNLENLEEDLVLMNPTNRWMVLQKLAAYFMPTLSKNDNTNTNSGEMKIVVEYSTPNNSSNTSEEPAVKDEESEGYW